MANKMFGGCHSLGFAALVERWRAMLAPGALSLMAPGWLPRANTWRLIWSQSRGGMWGTMDQAVAAAQAMGAMPMPPYNEGASQEANNELTEEVLLHAPPEVKTLTDGNGPMLWLSICAMVHFEQTGEGWREGNPSVSRHLEVPPEELAQRGLIAAISNLGPVSAGVGGGSGGNGPSEDATDRAIDLLQTWKEPANESLKQWRGQRAVWAAAVMTSVDEGTVRAQMSAPSLPAAPESVNSVIRLPGALANNLRTPLTQISALAGQRSAQDSGSRRSAAIRNHKAIPATLVEAMVSSYSSGYGKVAAAIIEAASLLFGLGIAVTFMSASALQCCSSVQETLSCAEQPGSKCDFQLMINTNIGVRDTTFRAETCRDLLGSGQLQDDVLSSLLTSSSSSSSSSASSLSCGDSAIMDAVVGALIGLIVMYIVKVGSAFLFNWLGGTRLSPSWRRYRTDTGGIPRRGGVKIYPAEYATLISPDGSPMEGMAVTLDKGAADEHVFKVYNAAATAARISIAVRAVVATVVIIAGLVLCIVASFGFYSYVAPADEGAAMVAFGMLLGLDILIELLLVCARLVVSVVSASKRVSRSGAAYMSWTEEYADLSSMVGVQEQFAKDMCHNIR